MSETPDISEVQTIPAIAAMLPGANVLGDTEDFEPLIDDIGDPDFTSMPPMSGKRRHRSRWLLWLIIGLLIVLVGGGLFVFLRTSQLKPITYTLTTATVGNLTVTVAGSGPVEPNAIYGLNFSASAPITAIYVNVGERVKQGQELAALDPTTLQDAVNQAQQTVNSAETSLSQTQTTLSNTQSQQYTSLNIAKLNEQKSLTACIPPSTPTPSGASPTSTATTTVPPTPTPNVPATVTAESNCEQLATQQFAQSQQQANAAITSAKNQVTLAENQVSNVQTALQTAKDNLRNDVLIAPHAGLIEAVNGLIGETVNASNSSASTSGSGSSSAFMVLIDDSTLSIQASVAESDVSTIQVGQAATFTVSAYPSQTFLASVASVDTLGATSSNVVSYTVDLAINMQSLGNAHIYAGMTATTSITTAERIGTLLVPATALTFSTTALQNGEITRAQLNALVSSSVTSGTRGIVVELKNGKLVPVLVTTGLTNGTDTEILSGLQEGDTVIVGQTGGTTTTTSSSTSGGGTRGGFGGGSFGGGN